MTISKALENAERGLDAAGVDSPRLDARLLLAAAMECRREDLIREPSTELTVEQQAAFENSVGRRVKREPLPYILGEQHFYGRVFRVTPDVLIPRPETEILVTLALAKLGVGEGHKIVDVGTGSGCIAVTLACERPSATVWATDISAQALAVAKANAEALGADCRCTFVIGDLLEPFLSGEGPANSTPFDLIVSNPPYIAETEISGLQTEVRKYEPRTALAGIDAATGVDGAQLYPRLFAQALRLLRPGGWILVEIGFGQAEIVGAMATAAGLSEIEGHPDLARILRVIAARRPLS